MIIEGLGPMWLVRHGETTFRQGVLRPGSHAWEPAVRFDGLPFVPSPSRSRDASSGRPRSDEKGRPGPLGARAGLIFLTIAGAQPAVRVGPPPPSNPRQGRAFPVKDHSKFIKRRNKRLP